MPWHPAWVLLALVLGFAVGVVIDQLGPPQRVNLLAPAVWAVVAWNLLIYAALVLPMPTTGLRELMAGWGHRDHSEVSGLWTRHTMPLTLERLALLMHCAAAALALGLISGLYLRGLVLDYRAGWQSTFLDAAAVQALLHMLLGPAHAVTGINLPDVAPLRVGPDGLASASAAPWIHLFAATLALFVVLPRTLLALRAGLRSRQLSQNFPLPLDTSYFESLHPLMQPGVPRAIRLLWAGGSLRQPLFGTEVGMLQTPLTLLRSDEGDELQLLPLPPALQPGLPALPGPESAGGRWRRWLRAADPLQATLSKLRESTDAVLLVAEPGAARPDWLATLARPVVSLVDEDGTSAPVPGDNKAGDQVLGLRSLADGWLPDGRLLSALEGLFEGDPRLRRLRACWTARQQAHFDAGVAELATCLARMACMREPVADEGILSRRSEADAARAALARALDQELHAHGSRQAALLGHPPPTEVDASLPATAALRSRVGEGRAALMGGVVTGALAGLTADLMSGGLTLGAGLVTGGLVGALGGAGVARGLNIVRGTDHSFAVWDEQALNPVTEALLVRHLTLMANRLPPESARQRLAPALAAHQQAIDALWRGRLRRFDNAGEAEHLAQALQPLLAQTLRSALGGPA